MRDARILTIYEGTTGIQALDLMGRKMLRDKGQAMGELIAELKIFSQQLDDAEGNIGALAVRFAAALAALEDATNWYLQNVTDDPDLGSAVGVDYLMLVGNVACAWLMGISAMVAQGHIENGSSDHFYSDKINTALFFAEHILPRSEAQALMVKAGSASVMAVDVDNF
ncbi:MAG: acyl-CoA dehydrogenase, partial [Gammaproteobacteria bacterium]|nr:acyl-CoA dehydrogenase [Gammaproteobacteria bacterium]